MERLKHPARRAADPCPCGSTHPYPDCRGRFIAGTALPETAEQLMRSRDSAYARGEAPDLAATWDPDTAPADLAPDPRVRWIVLQIIATGDGGPDRHGTVEFIARYQAGGGRARRLHERGRFRRHQDRWYYVDGEIKPDPAD